MAIVIVCPGCKARLTFDDDRAGDTVECPDCAESLQVKKPPRAKAMDAPDEEDKEEEDEETVETRRRLRRRLPKPAKAFAWWVNNLKGGKFPFTCPDCRKIVRLRQRDTDKPRKCSKCGFIITVLEIDKQLAEMEPERQELMDRPSGNNNGCGAAILFVLLPALALGSLFGCAKRAPEPEPPSAVVIVEPTGSMVVDDNVIPPPRPVLPAAEPSDAKDAEEVFIISSANGTWKAQYPNGQRVVIGGNPRVITETERKAIGKLVLPVNKPVRFTCIAEEDATIFKIPAFPLAIDVKAGRYTSAAVKPTRTGEFELWNARERVGAVFVVPAKEFNDWLAGFASPEPKPVDGTLAHEGQQLFVKLQCINCHSANARAKAPALEGLFGQKVALKGGGIAIADEAYIIESIRKPRQKVVEGWEAIMPAYDKDQVSDDEVNALVAYIKTLKKGEKPKEERVPAPNGPPK